MDDQQNIPCLVFLSNGPGDPAAVTYAIDNLKQLLGRVPIFGICLGPQLLRLALGGKTYNLKLGHHGGSQHHPEAAPGPHDARYLFRNFVDLMKG